MEFLKDGWPWWVAGGTVAIIMHFAVKSAKIRLRPEQLASVEAEARAKASGLIGTYLKFVWVWIALLIISTVLLAIFLKR